MAMTIEGSPAGAADVETETHTANRRITWNLEVSPLTIQIMFACFCTPEPSAWFEPAQWSSKAGIEVKCWLLERGLITGDDGIPHEEPRATDRGKAWVGFICSTPLPVAHWVLPPREEPKP